MSMMDAKIVTLNFLSETSNSERFARKRNPIDRKSRLKTQISFSKRELVVIMTECYKLRERVKVIGDSLQTTTFRVIYRQLFYHQSQI